MSEEADKAARVCSIYSDWCRNWGLDRNMHVAMEAAAECAEAILISRDLKLPDDDEAAGLVIFRALQQNRGAAQ